MLRGCRPSERTSRVGSASRSSTSTSTSWSRSSHASIIPVVMGSDSQVLDVGRSSRTFPTAIRRAITVRDKGCTFPGCDRPPGWTDAHHVKEWFHDGVSSYENGCLLCRFHHTLIHKGDWRIQWAADGIPEFIPPPWLDPEQKPRRNIMHNTAALLDMRQEPG